MKTVLERFNEKYKVTPSGCWEWQASKYPKGYGQFRISLDGKTFQYAHRISMYLFKEFDLNSDLNVCHKCDNTSCVNPDHLFLGTQDDNLKDMASKGRHVCWNRRLTSLDKEYAIFLREHGVSLPEIAKELNISIPWASEVSRGLV